MDRKLLAIFIICLLTAFGEIQDKQYPFRDCGSQIGRLTKFTIGPCKESLGKCAINHSFNATIEILFDAYEVVTDIEVSVRAIILYLNIRLDLESSRGCFSGLNPGKDCPLQKGQSYNYTQKWCTWNVPKYPAVLRWYLKDSKTGKNIVCAETSVSFM